MNEQKTDLVHLTIDGKEVAVPKGTTIYTITQQLGIDIPIFCYQDRMPPFGACRVCLVEVEKMAKPQTSCTLVATEGMVVKTQSTMAVKGREEILEFLLINHPLDCPICDRGGECPLQEQTLQFGPGESRFYEEKRHFKKPLPLGPVLMLDRERCIVCARCTRFGDEIAGDHALEFIERGYKTEVGTPDGGPAESKFIGNTIMICPVGALTSQVYRFRARPWDNEPTNSACTLCPIGCSMILDSRDGEIMRTRSLENKDLNDIWLCDKGWFGYEFTSNPARLEKPLIRQNGKLEQATWDQALNLVADRIKAAKPSGKLAALGGNPLTVEENYLFQQLMREGGGTNNVDHRVGMPIVPLNQEVISAGMQHSIGACEELNYAVLLGADLTEEFPIIWLRLRQAINRGAKVLFFGHFLPEIARHLLSACSHAPGSEIEIIQQNLAAFKDLGKNGQKGAVFIGRQYLDTPNRSSILNELIKWQQAVPNLALNILEGRGNSMGARWAGMRPDLAPFEEKLPSPGLNAEQMIENAAAKGWDFLYVAGADPANKFPSRLWIEARAKLGFLVVQELFLTETAQQADVVLPTLSYVEKGGSFINIERRVQTLMPGKEIPEGLFSDADIFKQIGQRLNLNLSLDARFLVMLKAVNLSSPQPPTPSSASSVPSPKKTDGLLATFAHALFDHGVRMQHNPHVYELAKNPYARLHPSEGIKRGVKDGDQIKIIASGSSVSAKIHFDEGVAANTIVLPLGFPEVPVQDLGSHLFNGMVVEIRR